MALPEGYVVKKPMKDEDKVALCSAVITGMSMQFDIWFTTPPGASVALTWNPLLESMRRCQLVIDGVQYYILDENPLPPTPLDLTLRCCGNVRVPDANKEVSLALCATIATSG